MASYIRGVTQEESEQEEVTTVDDLSMLEWLRKGGLPHDDAFINDDDEHVITDSDDDDAFINDDDEHVITDSDDDDAFIDPEEFIEPDYDWVFNFLCCTWFI